MVKFKDTECSIIENGSAQPLRECGVTFTDHSAETFVQANDLAAGFSIKISTDGFRSWGLAAFVFIDGIYRNNHSSWATNSPVSTLTPETGPEPVHFDFEPVTMTVGHSLKRVPSHFEAIDSTVKFHTATPAFVDELADLSTLEVRTREGGSSGRRRCIAQKWQFCRLLEIDFNGDEGRLPDSSFAEVGTIMIILLRCGLDQDDMAKKQLPIETHDPDRKPTDTKEDELPGLFNRDINDSNATSKKEPTQLKTGANELLRPIKLNKVHVRRSTLTGKTELVVPMARPRQTGNRSKVERYVSDVDGTNDFPDAERDRAQPNSMTWAFDESRGVYYQFPRKTSSGSSHNSKDADVEQKKDSTTVSASTGANPQVVINLNNWSQENGTSAASSRRGRHTTRDHKDQGHSTPASTFRYVSGSGWPPGGVQDNSGSWRASNDTVGWQKNPQETTSGIDSQGWTGDTVGNQTASEWTSGADEWQPRAEWEGETYHESTGNDSQWNSNDPNSEDQHNGQEGENEVPNSEATESNAWSTDNNESFGGYTDYSNNTATNWHSAEEPSSGGEWLSKDELASAEETASENGRGKRKKKGDGRGNGNGNGNGKGNRKGGRQGSVKVANDISDYQPDLSSLNAKGQRVGHARGHDLYARDERYLIPSSLSRELGISHQVKTSRGTIQTRLCRVPRYYDSLGYPFATFTFKFRSQDLVHEAFGTTSEDGSGS